MVDRVQSGGNVGGPQPNNERVARAEDFKGQIDENIKHIDEIKHKIAEKSASKGLDGTREDLTDLKNELRQLKEDLENVREKFKDLISNKDLKEIGNMISDVGHAIDSLSTNVDKALKTLNRLATDIQKDLGKVGKAAEHTLEVAVKAAVDEWKKIEKEATQELDKIKHTLEDIIHKFKFW